MDIIIFGTGMVYQKYKKYFSDMNILCFLDNNSKKWGDKLEEKLIVSPKEVLNYEYDYIFLTSVYYREMREQLLSFNVQENKIIDQEHLGIFLKINQIRRFEICECKRQNKGKILLLSHSFNLSGAPIVLCQLAMILQREGYFVEVYTKDDEVEGELLYQMLSHKISVSIFARFDLLDVDDICEKYDMVIVNTVILYPVIQKFSGKDIPVLWWLHEEENAYRGEHISRYSISLEKNIHVYAVGNRAKAAYEKYSKDSFADIMLYGIEDASGQKWLSNQGEKVIFALIGSGCERKGQDIVYEVVKNHINEWKEGIEILFVGDISESKRKIYNEISCINCTGILNKRELADIYNRIDVLLCPSLYDPMPVVVAEAMMHKKACIVSDMVGQCDYITPYVNGLICEAGNMRSLEKTIQWALDNYTKLRGIGSAGYDIYKQQFSIKEFEQRVMHVVVECMFGK